MYINVFIQYLTTDHNKNNAIMVINSHKNKINKLINKQ